jgi:D-sedoheptulose 7-phosphate isomerase
MENAMSDTNNDSGNDMTNDDMHAAIRGEFAKALANMQAMSADTVIAAQLVDAVTLSVAALRNGRKMLFAGNGGSAADAQHWAGELVSRFYYDRPGLPAIALTTDSSILTAIGNDYGFDYAFARQVEALGQAGDVFVAISTSGNSPNIIRAAEAARARGVHVIGFSGIDGGKLVVLSDVCFRIPSNETPRIQEGHEFVGHMLCALIEAQMYPRDGR